MTNTKTQDKSELSPFEKMMAANNVVSQAKQAQALLIKMLQSDGKAEAKETETYQASQMKRSETWITTGLIYSKLVEILTAENRKVSPELPKMDDALKTIKEKTGLSTSMIKRNGNIARFHDAYPIAATLFLTSLDKETIFKLTKKASADESAEARKEIERKRGQAMVKILDAIEAIHPDLEDGDELPLMNGAAVREFLKDFTDNGKGFLGVQFGNGLGDKIMAAGGELMPAQEGPDAPQKLSGEQKAHINKLKASTDEDDVSTSLIIRLLIDQIKGDAFEANADDIVEKAEKKAKNAAAIADATKKSDGMIAAIKTNQAIEEACAA